MEELLPYFERELGYLREDMGEFATNFPKVARRLQLHGDQCEDPHIKRLMESFAFLAARIRKRLDDESPQITTPLVESSYPHFLRPIPTATILQLSTEFLGSGSTNSLHIPRHTEFQTQEVLGKKYRFRTCFDLDLCPVRLTGVQLIANPASTVLNTGKPAAALLSLELEALGADSFQALTLDKLRFFLDGEATLTSLVYELLLGALTEARIAESYDNPTAPIPLAIQAVGFANNESMLDATPRSNPAYRLLSEYFAFPDKFMFFDIAGLNAKPTALQGKKLRIQCLFSHFGNSERHDRLLKSLSTQNFKLGCVPVVNLFKQSGKQITATQKLSYPVSPGNDRFNELEVYSIDAVKLQRRKESGTTTETLMHFFSEQNSPAEAKKTCYWHTGSMTTGPEKEGNPELSLVDSFFRPVRQDFHSIELELTCTNRNMVLPFEADSCNFSVPEIGSISSVRMIKRPTQSLRPNAKPIFHWQIIALASLRLTSEPHSSVEALQRALELCNFTNHQSVTRRIQSITAMDTRAITSRLSDGEPIFARGLEVSLSIDEKAFAQSNLSLFTKLLEQLFQESCDPNSFIHFRVATKPTKNYSSPK